MKKPSIFKRIRSVSLPAVLLNKYVFTLFVFAVWMTFFDENNFVHQYKRLRELNEAKRKMAYYVNETRTAEKQLHLLLTDQGTLEKFAREKYLMKRPDEDVFVIVD